MSASHPIADMRSSPQEGSWLKSYISLRAKRCRMRAMICIDSVSSTAAMVASLAPELLGRSLESGSATARLPRMTLASSGPWPQPKHGPRNTGFLRYGLTLPKSHKPMSAYHPKRTSVSSIEADAGRESE